MIKITTLLFFCITTFSAISQDTIYYDNYWNKLSSSKSAAYYQITESSETDKNQTTEKTYYKSGQLRSEEFFTTLKNGKKERNGKNSFWYESGELKNEISYENGVKNGAFLSYWRNAKVKRKDIFKNGKFKSGECWDETGNSVKHYDFEIRSKYPGGEVKMYKFIKDNLKYPPLSKQHNLGGKVIVEFKIDTDGSVVDINIAKGINKEIDDEAVRVIKSMPKWKIAYQDGIPARVRYSLPINFTP